MAGHARPDQLRVRDVFQIDRSLAITVDENVPLLDVVRSFVTRADLRGIFVVDEERRLTGVITRGDLLTWAKLVFEPRGFDTKFSWQRLLRLAQATTAKSACHPYSHLAAVRPDDPLREALAKMVSFDLIDVPVVDGRGRIVGDLRLTEILAKALERAQGRRSRRE